MLVEAKTIYLQAFEGKKILGPNHTLILNMVNILGNLYSDQGKLVEAEIIYL